MVMRAKKEKCKAFIEGRAESWANYIDITASETGTSAHIARVVLSL